MEASLTENIIAETTGKIAGISALPIPYIDVVAMTYFQYDMVNRLAEIHRVEVKDTTNLVISSLLSSLISKLVSLGIEKLASKTKIDNILQDSLIRASISGFLTTVVGEVYELHFRSGGNLEDIKLSHFVRYFRTQFESDRWSFSALSSDFLNAIDQQFNLSKI
jgi:uncharacterized protein (DUF697 family)